MALALTLDRGLAEDLVQTAYLRTYARWGRLRDRDPAAYARRIVVNEHTDRGRRHQGRESLTDDVRESSSAYDDSSGVSDRDAVLRALADLTPQERRVLVLRYLADLSETDTAAQLSIPRGTVKSVTHRRPSVRAGHRRAALRLGWHRDLRARLTSTLPFVPSKLSLPEPLYPPEATVCWARTGSDAGFALSTDLPLRGD